MFTAIEFANVQYFLLRYLEKRFKNLKITVASDIQAMAHHSFSMSITLASNVELPAALKLSFDTSAEVNLGINSLGSLRLEIIIPAIADFKILLEQANRQACGIMNLYFTGPGMRDWQVFVDETTGQSDIRIFQMTGAQQNKQLKEDIAKTMWSIIESMVDLTKETKNPGLNIAKKSVRPGGATCTTIPALNGQICVNILKGQGGLFISYKGYLRSLVEYDKERCFQDRRNVEFYIERSLTHSIYQPESFIIVEPLESCYRKDAGEAEIERNLAMTVGVIVSRSLPENKRLLPSELIIEAENKSRRPIQIQFLRIENNVASYRFIICRASFEALREVAYAMAVQILNVKLQYLPKNLSASVLWHFVSDSITPSYYNLFLRISPSGREYQGNVTDALSDVCKKLTGKTYKINSKNNQLTAIDDLGGKITVVKNPQGRITGLVYSGFSLRAMDSFEKRMVLDLHLSATPGSCPEELEEKQVRFPRAFAAEKLEVKSALSDRNGSDKNEVESDRKDDVAQDVGKDQKQAQSITPSPEQLAALPSAPPPSKAGAVLPARTVPRREEEVRAIPPGLSFYSGMKRKTSASAVPAPAAASDLTSLNRRQKQRRDQRYPLPDIQPAQDPSPVNPSPLQPPAPPPLMERQFHAVETQAAQNISPSDDVVYVPQGGFNEQLYPQGDYQAAQDPYPLDEELDAKTSAHVLAVDKPVRLPSQIIYNSDAEEDDRVQNEGRSFVPK